MIPDRFQDFLDDFGNFENLVKTWTHRPPNYYQNASTNTRKIIESFWKHISFVNLGFKTIRCVWGNACLVFLNIV